MELARHLAALLELQHPKLGEQPLGHLQRLLGRAEARHRRQSDERPCEQCFASDCMIKEGFGAADAATMVSQPIQPKAL